MTTNVTRKYSESVNTLVWGSLRLTPITNQTFCYISCLMGGLSYLSAALLFKGQLPFWQRLHQAKDSLIYLWQL